MKTNRASLVNAGLCLALLLTAFGTPADSVPEPGLVMYGIVRTPGLRACLKSRAPRRVRARGLQIAGDLTIGCRPGALTGRVFRQALSSIEARHHRQGPHMDTDRQSPVPEVLVGGFPAAQKLTTTSLN